MTNIGKILLGLMLTACCYASAQSNNRSYVRSVTKISSSDSIVQIDYTDGLGRAHETVMYGFSPLGNDIVTLQEYDSNGRHTNTWSPVSFPSTGSPIETSVFKQRSNTIWSDAYAYEKNEYEPSPLNRVARVTGSGKEWHTSNKCIKTERFTCSSAYQCANYVTVGDGSRLSMHGYLSSSQLQVEKVTDEDNKVTYTFTDGLGNVRLRRVTDPGGVTAYNTYYVYDKYGYLRFVLPPMASDALTANYTEWSYTHAAISNYGYYYEYDARGLCTKKKMPGSDPVIMVYDKAGRLIFSQDGNLRMANQWKFFLYDTFGREAVTGIHQGNNPPDVGNIVVEAVYTGSGPYWGYTSNISPNTDKLLTAIYYDNYDFINNQNSSTSTSLSYVYTTGYGTRYMNGAAGAKGLVTGKKQSILGSYVGTDIEAMYYDYMGRIIQTKAVQPLTGNDTHCFLYSQTGKLLKTKHDHTQYGSTNTEITRHTYDHADRLISVKHQLNNNAEVTVATYTYDSIGRTKTKTLASGETVSYNYNVRNWITGISSTHFSQTLAYNTAVNGLNPDNKYYGGNIGAMRWKAAGDSQYRDYHYTYDIFGRILAAWYDNESGNIEGDEYSVYYDYDKMGNLTWIWRMGLAADDECDYVDDLEYEYNGNQLIAVSDGEDGSYHDNTMHFVSGSSASVQFEYDKNGNLVKDLNKNISSIQYNCLNLPSQIDIASTGHQMFLYGASGSKQKTIHVVRQPNGSYHTTTVDYSGNFLYENNVLKKILIDGGYVTFSGTTPIYHFYLQDHQGNNCVVVNSNGTEEQVNHYYPYGALFGVSIGGEVQPFKFNGKELERFNGLDWYDYGARFLDPVLGRWMQVDPLCEKYYDVSPYAYCHNNPVNITDPDGRDDYYTYSGLFLFHGQEDTDNIIIRDQFLYDLKSITGAEWISPDTPLINANLSAEAYSAIYTDILNRNGFNTNKLKNGKISIVKLKDNINGDGPQYEADGFFNHEAIIPYRDADIARSKLVNNQYEITAYSHPMGDSNREYLSTVSNVISVLGIHEFKGHGLLKIGNNQHWRILQLQRDHYSWNNVSTKLKALYRYFETNKISNYNKE